MVSLLPLWRRLRAVIAVANGQNAMVRPRSAATHLISKIVYQMNNDASDFDSLYHYR